MKITDIVFDIGNVLAGFFWKDYLKSFGFSPEAEGRIAKVTFLGQNWREVDRGVLSDEEIYQNCLNEIPDLEEELKLVWKDRTSIVKEYGYAADWVKELKGKGYGVYILSNYGKTTFQEADRNFEFLKYVDGRVISYEVQAVKPEARIYEELIRRYRLIPEECVFLDDLPENIAAGKEFGFQTILFTGRERALEELKSLGVK